METNEMVEVLNLTPAQRAYAAVHEFHCRMAGIPAWTTAEEFEALAEVVDCYPEAEAVEDVEVVDCYDAAAVEDADRAAVLGWSRHRMTDGN